jgi:hypothetical protein
MPAAIARVQESFEDYSDHQLILYRADLGMLHEGPSDAIAVPIPTYRGFASSQADRAVPG